MFYAFLDPNAMNQLDTDSGESNPAYRQWQDAMKQYAKNAGVDGLGASRFWVLLRLPADKFSEKVEFHETIPMWIPKEDEGEFAGLAMNSTEIDKVIESTLDEETGNNKYVYLVYAVKIQGAKSWRDLLEFLGEHAMLEKY